MISFVSVDQFIRDAAKLVPEYSAHRVYFGRFGKNFYFTIDFGRDELGESLSVHTSTIEWSLFRPFVTYVLAKQLPIEGTLFAMLPESRDGDARDLEMPRLDSEVLRAMPTVSVAVN